MAMQMVCSTAHLAAHRGPDALGDGRKSPITHPTVRARMQALVPRVFTEQLVCAVSCAGRNTGI